MGYNNIDFLDGNEGMRKEAEKKGVYDTYYMAHLGHDKLPIHDSKYTSYMVYLGNNILSIHVSKYTCYIVHLEHDKHPIHVSL